MNFVDNEEDEDIGESWPWLWYPPRPGSSWYENPRYDPNTNNKPKRVVNDSTLTLVGRTAALLAILGTISFTVWKDISIPLASMWLGSAYGLCRFIVTEEE